MRPPWGTAIVHLGKRIENRTWATQWRGPLYIHQGHTFSEQGMHDRRVLTAYTAATEQVLEVMPYEACPQGVILGRAELVDCHRIGPKATCCGVWADRLHPDYAEPARTRVVHWVLADVQALDVPIVCSGGQGLWQLDQSIADEVDAALIAQRQARRRSRSPLDVTIDRLRRHIERGDVAASTVLSDLVERER